MACDIDTIKVEACVSGIGKLNSPLILLQVTAQLTCNLAPSTDCGTPTLTIAVTGAGDPLVNTSFVSADGGVTFTHIAFSISQSAGVWRIRDGLLNVLYTIPASQFPCGTWSVDTGIAPAPTAAYT